MGGSSRRDQPKNGHLGGEDSPSVVDHFGYPDKLLHRQTVGIEKEMEDSCSARCSCLTIFHPPRLILTLFGAGVSTGPFQLVNVSWMHSHEVDTELLPCKVLAGIIVKFRNLAWPRWVHLISVHSPSDRLRGKKNRVRQPHPSH